MYLSATRKLLVGRFISTSIEDLSVRLIVPLQATSWSTKMISWSCATHQDIFEIPVTEQLGIAHSSTAD